MTQAMRFDVSALDRASQVFDRVAAAAERLERKLKDLDKTKVEIKPRLDTTAINADIAALKKRLRDVGKGLPKIKLNVDLDGATAAERKVEQLRAKMAQLGNASAQVDVNTGGSATRLDLLARKMRDLKRLSPLKLKVEVDDQASPQLAAIEAAALALAGMRPTVQVDVDSTAALAQIAALQAALQALGATANTVNVNLNARSFLGELARIRQELNTIAGGRIEIDVETDQAMRELAALRVRLAELGQQDQTAVVRADTLLAQHQIRQLEERLATIARNTTTARVKVDVDRSWSDVAIKVAALAKALALLSIPVAIAGAVPLLGALGGAALSATGAVGLLPAALAGAGAAAAGLKVGLVGVGDALKNIGDAKKFAESLKELAPAAREFAVAVRDIAPAWKQVRLDTQQKLFAGLGVEMQKLSASYLPTMQRGLGAIGTEFNLLGKDFNTFASSSRTIENVDTIFRNTATAMQAARPAAQNLAGAFLDIAVVGSELMPELAAGLTAATGRFRTFIDQARRSGQLKVWMQEGIDTIKQLGSIAGNVAGTLGAVFSAQKAAGTDLLGTLDRVTAGMERWAKSAEGQRQMIAVFNEIRRTIDSIMPGLQALGSAAMQALEAFANTGALTAAGNAFTQLATAVAGILPGLAELAGGVVNNLANGFSAVVAVVGPLAGALTGLMGALGPIPAAVIAMVVAFKLLGPVNAMITGLGASLAGLATRLGASAGVAAGIATTFSRIGTAVPIVGVAVVGLAAAWDALTVSTTEAARAMDAGGAAAQEAAAGLAAQTAAVDGLQQSTGPLGDVFRTLGNVMALFTTSTDEARAAMTPLQQAQLDAATAANVHRLAVEQFGAASPQARSAAEDLATANDRVATEQDKAAQAGRTHADVIRDLGAAMQTQLGAALAYEEAVRRTAEAHKAAGDALKEGGAKSDEYQKSVLNLARSQEQQAQVAQRVAEATLGAEAGLQAYNVELLRLNDGTQQGRDAFVKLASNLTTTQLGMLSAAAAATGLKTEILTLPDGRTVTVVTAADTAKLEQVKADLNAVAAKEWIGTVTVVGDPTRVNDTLNQVVTFANGQTGTITLNGNSQPVQAVIGQTKYTIDATTGVLTIDGNPAPGEANLSGLKLKIDQTTGTITLEGNPAPAQGDITALEQPTQSEHTVEGNPAPAEGAITGLEQPSSSTHTVNPDAAPAQGAVDGLKAPTSSTHTINVDAGPVTAAKAAAQVASASIHTINVDAGPVQQAVAAAQTATSSMHTLNCDDKAVVDAKSRAEQATSSMHTINCNDSAVTSAKAAAQRSTSSTHTIHVRVVGAPVPRAAGAYVTPRAEGAYAAPMAAGGMRKMSAGRAEIVPPRQPRLIGDRMQGDEAFIPINRSARSLSILATAANRMGQDLVPRMTDRPTAGATPDGLLSSMRSAVSQRPATRPGGGDTRVVAAIEALRHDLAATPRQIHNEINVQGAGADETADAVAKRQRRTAALGLFG